MHPFAEPELVQNSQQATSQHYVTTGRHQGLRTVLPGQGHWYSFRLLTGLRPHNFGLPCAQVYWSPHCKIIMCFLTALFPPTLLYLPRWLSSRELFYCICEYSDGLWECRTGGLLCAAPSEVNQHTERTVLKPGEKTSNATSQTSYTREKGPSERERERVKSKRLWKFKDHIQCGHGRTCYFHGN